MPRKDSVSEKDSLCTSPTPRFNNSHCHEYPQWKRVKLEGMTPEQWILETGMVENKTRLKSLKKQGAVKHTFSVDGVMTIRIGQRFLEIELYREIELC